MAEPTQAKGSERRQFRTRPQREHAMQKELVSVRHGARVNEFAEDQADSSGILQQRAAVRSMPNTPLQSA